MKVTRLLEMSLPEVADRGRQETSKFLERTGLLHRHRSGGDPAGALPSAATEFGACFFPGAVDPATARILAERMPAAVRGTLRAAESIGRGRIDLLGYRGLAFGDPIDWHLDPVSGCRSPLVHWSRLRPLEPRRAGDSKVVWELNRHQWLVTLARAARLSGDERPARLVAEHLRHWLRANPAGMGINWASSLEVSLRLIAWCWILALLDGREALDAALRRKLAGALEDHAEHVARYLSRYFSPNTHLTGEALGLTYAGLFLADRPGAARWRALGADILAEEIERQVLTDGVHFEQSTCYQRYTIEIYLHYLILARRAGIDPGARLTRRLGDLLDSLILLRRPDGSIPAIGDADGGWLMPLASRRPGDARGIFAVAAALFGRADWAWAAGGTAPEIVWLLGRDGLAAWDAIAPEAPRTPPSRVLPDGGYAVMRDGWDARAQHLIFDVGPLGCPWSAGHGHADLLSVQCSVRGRNFLEDAGTYGYTAAPRWRDYFRGTAAHSSVVIDGRGQATPAGPFSWQRRPRARLRAWRSDGDLDYADAEHDGYTGLDDPVVHRRRVLFVKKRYWVIVDELSGAAMHQVEIRFQFAPLEVTLLAGGAARATAPGGAVLHVVPFGPVPLQAAVRAGREAPIEGWISRDYGRRVAAPVLVYSALARLPFRVITLLHPGEVPGEAAPVVRPIGRSAAGPIGIVFEATGESVRFDAEGCALGRG